MIRILYQDLSASHGSTLWCNHPRQNPRGQNLARRVPHRLHRLRAEKPLVEQGLPEPESRRNAPAGHPRGQVRLICKDASVPPLPSSPLPWPRPLWPHRGIRSDISGRLFGVLGVPPGCCQTDNGPCCAKMGLMESARAGLLSPMPRFPGRDPGGEPRALARSTHRPRGAPPGFPRPLPRGDHRFLVLGSAAAGSQRGWSASERPGSRSFGREAAKRARPDPVLAAAALAGSSKRVCRFSLCLACPPALVRIAFAPLATEALAETSPL
jgi:hypothetical protein